MAEMIEFQPGDDVLVIGEIDNNEQRALLGLSPCPGLEPPDPWPEPPDPRPVARRGVPAEIERVVILYRLKGSSELWAPERLKKYHDEGGANGRDKAKP